MKIPHRNAILIPLAAASLLFLAACGNKGPLVLPQKPVPVEEPSNLLPSPLPKRPRRRPKAVAPRPRPWSRLHRPRNRRLRLRRRWAAGMSEAGSKALRFSKMHGAGNDS